MLTPPTLSHLLWSLPCLRWLQLLMSSTRASPTMRSPYWCGSSKPFSSSARRGGYQLVAASSGVTPPTSSPTAPRGRSSTPPTSTTTPTGMTLTTRATTKRSTDSGTTTRRRSSRRSCPEHVLPQATLTSSVMTPPAQMGMRMSSVRKATSPAFASWENL
jgi:hypothetical protein